jgi:hypothetical protein
MFKKQLYGRASVNVLVIDESMKRPLQLAAQMSEHFKRSQPDETVMQVDKLLLRFLQILQTLELRTRVELDYSSAG